MEDLFCLRKLLQEEDYTCKLDMKDAYFSVPLHKSSRIRFRFSWSGNLYELLCLCFGMRPASRILKIPIFKITIPIKIAENTKKFALRKINIRIVMYLDDMLIMGQTMENIIMSRDTLIFLLQHLGVFLNLEISILNPVQEIEFLGGAINSLKMCISLSQWKALKIQIQCQDIDAKGQVIVHKLMEL